MAAARFNPDVVYALRPVGKLYRCHLATHGNAHAGYQQQTPSTNDLSVRAIEHAVNKDAIVKNRVMREKKPIRSTPPTAYANIGLKLYAYRLTEAARLFDAAGWKMAAGQCLQQRCVNQLNLYFVGKEGKDKAISEVVQLIWPK